MKEPLDIVFFTDRDLGKRFPAILKEAGIRVERHVDHFADDAKDEEWLSEIGKRGWYAITHDQRIRISLTKKQRLKNLELVYCCCRKSALLGTRKKFCYDVSENLPLHKKIPATIYCKDLSF